MQRNAMPAAVVLLFSAATSFADAGLAQQGSSLFEQKCAACHTIGGGDRVGPDLQGVTARRPEEWMRRFIMDPNALISAGDPVATRLVAQFNQIIMPNLGLQEAEATALIEHLRSSGAAQPAPEPQVTLLPQPALDAPQRQILWLFLAAAAVIVGVFTQVALSTRSPAEVDVKRAYAVRRVFFICGVGVLGGILLATITRTPYAIAGVRPDRIVYVAARQFDFVFSDEPITSVGDLPAVPHADRLQVPAGALVEFRVTSLDVNHGFGVYGAERQLLAQTQAMPGYFNRLLVRMDTAAQYRVLCLEYCAAGHHLMQSVISVE